MRVGTFRVDHHGGKTTDPHLCWDEVCKAAYRSQCTSSIVAGDHIGGLRARIAALEVEVEMLRGEKSDLVKGLRYYVKRWKQEGKWSEMCPAGCQHKCKSDCYVNWDKWLDGLEDAAPRKGEEEKA